MLATAGITCPQAAPGPDSTGCSAGLGEDGKPYDVELQAGCGDDGFFAAVWQSGGAGILPRLPIQAGAPHEHGATLADKQFVRDHLETLDWDKTAPGPTLPAEVIERTRDKYAEALHKLAGIVID